MTLLAVVLAWTALSVLTVLGLALLFCGRRRWEHRAAAPAGATPSPAGGALPLAG